MIRLMPEKAMLEEGKTGRKEVLSTGWCAVLVVYKHGLGHSSFLNATGPVKPVTISFSWNHEDIQGQKYWFIILEKKKTKRLACLYKFEQSVHCCKLSKFRPFTFTSTVPVLTSLKYFSLSSIRHLRLQVFHASKKGQASHFANIW